MPRGEFHQAFKVVYGNQVKPEPLPKKRKKGKRLKLHGRKKNSSEWHRKNKCPECSSEKIRVCDTRQYEEGRVRRRACLTCNHRWGTVEIPMDLYQQCFGDFEDG